MSELKPLECPCCHRLPTIMPNRIGDFYAICYTNEPDEMACGMSTSDQRCETERGAVERWNKFVTAALLRGARIGLEMAAKTADVYADANIEMAGDSVLTDPILRGKPLTAENIAASEARMVDGCVHSSMYHASRNIAEATRAITDDEIMEVVLHELA